MFDDYMKAKIRDNATKLISFLRQEGVTIPNEERFLKECVNNALYAGTHSLRYLGKKDAKNAVAMADYWRAALATSEEYTKLVEGIIFSLYRLQACAINNNAECEKLFLGRYCKINPTSELANGSREYNLHRTYVGVGSKGIVKA